MTSEPTIDLLLRRLLSLFLGASDMRDVWETGRYLLGDHEEAPGHIDGVPEKVRRTLETGMVISYARPFLDSRRGLQQLKRARGLSDELRTLHEEILQRRHRVYAHTGNAEFRRILEFQDPGTVAEWLRDPAATFSEEWQSPAEAGLLSFIALSSAHLDWFSDEIERLRPSLLARLDAVSSDSAKPMLPLRHAADVVGIDGQQADEGGDLRPRVTAEFTAPEEEATPMLLALGQFVFAAASLEQALRLEAVRLSYVQMAAGKPDPQAAISSEIDHLRRLPAGGLRARLRELGIPTDLHDRLEGVIDRRNDLVHRTLEDADLIAALIGDCSFNEVAERIVNLATECGELSVELTAFAVAKLEELFGMSRQEMLDLVLSADPETVTDPVDARLVRMLLALDPSDLVAALDGLGSGIGAVSPAEAEQDSNQQNS